MKRGSKGKPPKESSGNIQTLSQKLRLDTEPRALEEQTEKPEGKPHVCRCARATDVMGWLGPAAHLSVPY